MSPRGRACPVCRREGRTSRMRAHLRHLHELEPGERFRIGRKVGTVEAHRHGRSTWIPARVSRETVSFEANGKKVSFTRGRSAAQPICSAAMVEPLPTPDTEV